LADCEYQVSTTLAKRLADRLQAGFARSEPAQVSPGPHPIKKSAVILAYIAAGNEKPVRESAPLWVRAERCARVLPDPQDFVQVPVIEGVPETSYDLSVSLRLIRNYELDLTQHECEDCVAAAHQGRSYGGRLDEFAYSRNGRAVRKLVHGWKILPQQVL
jgi:hypothetical protein